MNQHHVGGHSADHGPKHAPGSISGEGCRTGKQITCSKNKTALRRHIPYAQNRLTGTTPLPKSGAYEFLAPAAETLAEKHPLAATVALRAMIDFTLNEGRQKRYGYAAQHLATCADLAGLCCQFNANSSQWSAGGVGSGCAELTPLVESGGAVQLEVLAARERSILVEMVAD